jgi:hypothetical protein
MRKYSLLAMVCSLAACGGGGGGGGSWLSFSPSHLQGVTYQGEPSLNLSITATSSKSISDPVQLGIVLDQSVFTSVVVSPPTGLSELAELTVRNDLPVGVVSGTVEVRICYDDPQTCAQPYAGSPWKVPYQIEVKSSDALPTDVTNGDFGSGTTGWYTWANQGSLSLAATNGMLRVTTSSTDFATSMGLEYDGGIDLEGGTEYSLSFDAKADAPRTIVPMVSENGRDLNGNGFPYDDYIIQGSTLVSPSSVITGLTTTMSHYELDFTMPVTNRYAGVVFYLGGSSSTLYFDNISVSKVP